MRRPPRSPSTRAASWASWSRSQQKKRASDGRRVWRRSLGGCRKLRVKIMRMRSSGVASRSRRGKRRKEKRKAAAALRNAAEIPRRWSTRTRSSAAASRMRRGWRRSAEVIVSPAAAAKVTSTATGGTTPATISTAPSTAPGGTTLWTSGAATLWASGAAALRTSCANILCTSCAATARAVPLVISSNSRSQKHTPTTSSLARFRNQITPARRAS
mmetsp:Transcript_41831/g.131084  ORF Transcript_41831/g.131084 Transcript_41831/m.131084 type:complete len:215 (+) Transcript_41831:1263-1907(+)